MTDFRIDWRSCGAIAALSLAVAGLSGCATAIGFHEEDLIPVTIQFRTTSDHFGFRLEGTWVSDTTVEPDLATLVQPQWAHWGGAPVTVEGAQGVDLAQRGKSISFVLSASLRKKEGEDVLLIPYWKGYMGTSTLTITYPDVAGKRVTRQFNAAPGPAQSEGVWKLPLKPVPGAPGEPPPAEPSGPKP